MNRQPITSNPEDRTAALSVVGIRITVLATRDQTGSHEVTLQEGPEGAGPPPHSHGWDESFFVLHGDVDYLVDGKPVRASTGSFVHLPAGAVHTFRFGPGGGAMLEIAGHGSNATAMFRHLDKEVPPGPPDLPKVVAILAEHGVRLGA